MARAAWQKTKQMLSVATDALTGRTPTIMNFPGDCRYPNEAAAIQDLVKRGFNHQFQVRNNMLVDNGMIEKQPETMRHEDYKVKLSDSAPSAASAPQGTNPIGAKATKAASKLNQTGFDMKEELADAANSKQSGDMNKNKRQPGNIAEALGDAVENGAKMMKGLKQGKGDIENTTDSHTKLMRDMNHQQAKANKKMRDTDTANMDDDDNNNNNDGADMATEEQKNDMSAKMKNMKDMDDKDVDDGLRDSGSRMEDMKKNNNKKNNKNKNMDTDEDAAVRFNMEPTSPTDVVRATTPPSNAHEKKNTKDLFNTMRNNNNNSNSNKKMEHSSTMNDVSNDMKEVLSGTTKTTASASGSGESKMKEMWNEAKDTASQMKDKWDHSNESFADIARDSATETASKLKNKFSQAKEAVSDAVENSPTASKMKDEWNEAKDTASQMKHKWDHSNESFADIARDTATETTSKLKDKYNQAKEAVTDAVENSPTASTMKDKFNQAKEAVTDAVENSPTASMLKDKFNQAKEAVTHSSAASKVKEMWNEAKEAVTGSASDASSSSSSSSMMKEGDSASASKMKENWSDSKGSPMDARKYKMSSGSSMKQQQQQQQQTGDQEGFASHEVELKEFHRFEGASNPDDMSVIYALEVKKKGIRGILQDAYGMYGDSDIEEFISQIKTPPV